jgi:hypothetical protein
MNIADKQDDEISRMLQKVLSPAEAQSLVLPPPTHAPASGPAESTPLSGSLAKPPSQATPSRQSTPGRQGLASYFSNGFSNQDADPAYVKISSKGQIGYLPRVNLEAAKRIDSNLKVLNEDQTRRL